jgi:hypothetical protein
MKQFISTKLFLALQESLQNGIDVDTKVLRNDYDEFVNFVFQGRIAFTDRSAYHDALVYTHVELATLPEASRKKMRLFICTKPSNLLMRKSHG